ncbi:MAG: hypothetical protein ACI31M_03115 [Bacilli bacterium]
MKKDKFLLIAFISIIFSVLLLYPVTYYFVRTGKVKIVMTDNWQFFSPVKENSIVDKINNKINSKKISLENRITNYFPFYIKINTLYENANYLTNSFIYDNIPIKKNSDGDLLFYNKKDELFYLETSYGKEELDQRLNDQIAFFNNLSNQGIDISIYIPTRYELTTLKKNNLNSYIDKFEKELNNDIKVSHMNIESIEEYKQNFYLTDHHWSMIGALNGYTSIMNLLGVPSLDTFSLKTYDSVKFYGTMAKTSMLKNKYDYLQDIDLNLKYDVLVNGKEPSEKFKPRELKKSNNDFYDYYVSYFNGQYGEITYDYHDESKDNLLIISDSYVWEIDYLIAASFNKTYVINLRYDEFVNNKLDLSSYMGKNDIDKVLFLYEGGSILFDQNNYNMKDRVI